MRTNRLSSGTGTNLEREVKRLQANGKAPDIIALRLGVKISKILAIMHKPVEES